MKNLFIVLLVVFGLSSVASAQDPDISLAYFTGTTGYLELYDNPTLDSVPNSSTALEMIDVGRLPNGNTIAAYTSGGSQYMELYDPNGDAIGGASLQLDDLIAVSGLANGDIVAAYTSGSLDYVEIYDGTTLTTTGASASFDTVMDITGTQGGDIVVAYNPSTSVDYVEHYDLSLTALPTSWKSFSGVEHVTGMANGDVAVYYGAATNYLQFFDWDGVDTWTGGAWKVQQYAIDIAGLANGDILVGYNTGGSSDYLQVIDPTLTTWRTPFLEFEHSDPAGITALEGDYLGSPGNPPTDPDGNGIVDGNDFLILQRTDPSLIPDWELDYGGPPSLVGASGGIAAVPEPSSILLLVGMMTMISVRRREASL